MTITSLENEKIKNLVKLQQKKYRDLMDCYLVEGEHLVEEVLKTNQVMELFLLDGTSYSCDCPITYVSFEVMKRISTLDTPTSMVALCRKRQDSSITGNKVLLLDSIQDPGNLGTIIRSSVAFGVDTIILSENTVDLYNPKVLRATQGMFCHIPIISWQAEKAIAWLKENHYMVYGTNVENGVDVKTLTAEEKQKFCLIMGNEGNGVRRFIQEMCDKNLYISMNSKVESLNVGIACSILLYEFNR